MLPDDLILGIDIGTTAVKGAVYSLNGQCVYSKRIPYKSNSPHPGWVEQVPEDWIECITTIWEGVNQTLEEGVIHSIGICSQANTHVFIDEKGNPLLNAVVWQDQRCADVAMELDNQISHENRKRWWYDGFKVDSSSLLSRAAWLSRFHPDLWKRTRWILLPKDYCIMRLTNEVATDALSSVGLVSQSGEYLSEVLALVEGLEDRLPPLRELEEIAGKTSGESFGKKIPLVIGTMDAWGNLYGSGTLNVGQGFQVSGTSEIIGLVSNKCNVAQGIITFPPVRGMYLHAGPTQSGGDSLTWLAKAVNKNIDEVLHFANQVNPMTEPIIFLPYLMGERAPIWDPNAKGTFIGLNKRHTQHDMALAVLIGVGLSARHLLEVVEQAAGVKCLELRLSGGAAKSDLWCQIKANIINKSLHRLAILDSGTFGAALMGAVGTGIFSDLNDAAQNAVRIERVFEPDITAVEWFDELYHIYRDAYFALQPIFKRLSGLS